jgi:diguanylate cyclase (GGDEF)-like protein/PAS domain S-box-containing protein
MIFEPTYDYSVVMISAVFAMAAVYATIHFAGPASGLGRWRRIAWLAAAAAILGAGLRFGHDFGLSAFRSQTLFHYSTVLLVTVAAVISSATAIRTAKRENAARANAARFETLAEAIPQIIWIADASGRTTYLNHSWFQMTGTSERDAADGGWVDEVHPDDRAPLSEKWQACVRSGETFEIEYRLHDAAHGYRWYLDRAVPLRDETGSIQQWFGTCTDIEEQKHYQQILEQQIKERTEELADTNTRLQQEMWEKDLARRTLDEQNEEMMQTLKERSQRATLLAKMGELLQSCQTREEVFTAALGFAPRIFPSRRGAVALFNPAHNLVEVAGQWHDCQLPVTSFEPESCWALRTGHPHLVLAGETTARCNHAAGVESAYLCVPILAQGEALGILHIQATDQNPSLGEAELSFKTTFTAQVGLSVANIRLREALRAQSTKDPLTGLYNRRYLQEMLDREIRRAIRSEQALGVLMLDLDHFKNFNDTYGHDAGDAVLRETASFLVRSIRAEDFVCRYGGEEFVVILPTADLRAAEARAQRIRAKLRDLVILHNGRSLGLITASIGVAALPAHGTNEKELLQAADAALYRAKREGRDRVAVAEAPIAADRPPNAAGIGV